MKRKHAHKTKYWSYKLKRRRELKKLRKIVKKKKKSCNGACTTLRKSFTLLGGAPWRVCRPHERHVVCPSGRGDVQASLLRPVRLMRHWRGSHGGEVVGDVHLLLPRLMLTLVGDLRAGGGYLLLLVLWLWGWRCAGRSRGRGTSPQTPLLSYHEPGCPPTPEGPG